MNDEKNLILVNELNILTIKNLYLLFIVFVLFSPLVSEAKDCPPPKQGNLDFVYIHGVGHYTEPQRKEFNQAAHRLHVVFSATAEQNKLFKEEILSKYQLTINPTEHPFFWGDLLLGHIERIDTSIQSIYGLQLSLVDKVQKILYEVMYVGFWFGKDHNQFVITQKLHKYINQEVAPENKIFIMAHSAGAIILYYYLMRHLPYISFSAKFDKTKWEPDVQKELADPSLKYSCLQALEDSGLVVMNKQGKFILFMDNLPLKDKTLEYEFRNAALREGLVRLKKFNKQDCLEAGRLKGVVTFGSPIAGIASKGGDAEGDVLLWEMVRYIYQNGIYWMQVNHAEDPIGFPVNDENILKKIVASEGFLSDFNEKGFLVNNNSYRSSSTFVKAHTWYLQRPDEFSVQIMKAMDRGFKTLIPQIPSK